MLFTTNMTKHQAETRISMAKGKKDLQILSWTWRADLHSRCATLPGPLQRLNLLFKLLQLLLLVLLLLLLFGGAQLLRIRKIVDGDSQEDVQQGVVAEEHQHDEVERMGHALRLDTLVHHLVPVFSSQDLHHHYELLHQSNILHSKRMSNFFSHSLYNVYIYSR